MQLLLLRNEVASYLYYAINCDKVCHNVSMDRSWWEFPQQTSILCEEYMLWSSSECNGEYAMVLLYPSVLFIDTYGCYRFKVN